MIYDVYLSGTRVTYDALHMHLTLANGESMSGTDNKAPGNLDEGRVNKEKGHTVVWFIMKVVLLCVYSKAWYKSVIVPLLTA